tara:strand:- start:681 stop:875 length:195 start_codon:yes stop_codon:yes gene_type:complete
MKLSEYKSGDRVNYYQETMNPDDMNYPGSVIEVKKVDGEYVVLVKIDHQNLIYSVTENTPGYIK